jgi:hypothetical protein
MSQLLRLHQQQLAFEAVEFGFAPTLASAVHYF